MNRMKMLMCSAVTLVIAANIFLAAVMIFYGLRDRDKSMKFSSAFVALLAVVNSLFLGGGYVWAF